MCHAAANRPLRNHIKHLTYNTVQQYGSWRPRYSEAGLYMHELQQFGYFIRIYVYMYSWLLISCFATGEAIRKPVCTLLQYKCTNGNCIDGRKVCDDVDDCHDASDENGCSEYISLYLQFVATSSFHFRAEFVLFPLKTFKLLQLFQHRCDTNWRIIWTILCADFVFNLAKRSQHLPISCVD